MRELDLRRLEELRKRFPADPHRQIAHYVMNTPDAPDDDRLCALAILGALDGADHSEYLTVIPVNAWTLSSAAFEEANRLWAKYGDDAES
jgi:hypothetical protein